MRCVRGVCSWAWFGDASHWSCSDDGEPDGTVRPRRHSRAPCAVQRKTAVGRSCRTQPQSWLPSHTVGQFGRAGGTANSFGDRAAGSPLCRRLRGTSHAATLRLERRALRGSRCVVCVVHCASCAVRYALHGERCILSAACCLLSVVHTVRICHALLPPTLQISRRCDSGLRHASVQKRWFGGVKLGAGTPRRIGSVLRDDAPRRPIIECQPKARAAQPDVMHRCGQVASRVHMRA
jgi:hypothetical protein